MPLGGWPLEGIPLPGDRWWGYLALLLTPQHRALQPAVAGVTSVCRALQRHLHGTQGAWWVW